MTDEHLLGYCPICGKPGFSRERRPNGNDKCEAGHTYPSRDATIKSNKKPPLCTACGAGLGEYHSLYDGVCATCLKENHDRLLALLKKLEWCKYDAQYATEHCPVCGADGEGGHHSAECAMRIALEE